MAPKKDAAQQRKSEIYTNVYFFYDFGRWGAWAREPRVGGARLFIGTHLTERLAARCQDRALLKMETEPWSTKEIQLNFKREDYAEDEDLRNSTTTADFVKYLSGESRGKYNKLQPTACLLKFLAEEEAPLKEEVPLEEGPLRIPAPKKPVSRGKRPKPTNTKQNKKPKTKGEWGSSNEEESDHCPSEPEVHARGPLAAVAPVAPLPQWTGQRLRSVANGRARQFALVAPVPLIGSRQALEGPLAPWTTERQRTRVNRTISKDQGGASEALRLIQSKEEEGAFQALQLMPSKEEEALHQALLMLTSGRGSGRIGVSGAISKDEEDAAEALLVLSLGTGRGTV